MKEKPLVKFVIDNRVLGDDPWHLIKVLEAHNNLLRGQVDRMRRNGRSMVNVLQTLALQHGGRFSVKKADLNELSRFDGLSIVHGDEEVAIEFIPEKRGL